MGSVFHQTAIQIAEIKSKLDQPIHIEFYYADGRVMFVNGKMAENFVHNLEKSQIVGCDAEEVIWETKQPAAHDKFNTVRSLAQSYLGLLPKDKNCANWDEMHSLFAHEILDVMK